MVDTLFRTQLAAQAVALRPLARALARGVDAEDVVQDTIVAALEQTTPPRSVGPWLRKVLRNEVRAGVRRLYRRRAREGEVARSQSAASPTDELERIELIGAVTQLLDGLEEPYRDALRQRFLLGRTPLEIARAIGDPPATVRWRVHEGLRRMRLRLDDRYQSRQRWVGALVPVFGLPASVTSPGAAMKLVTPISFAAVSVAVVLAGLVVLTGVHDDAAASNASTPAIAADVVPTERAEAAQLVTPSPTVEPCEDNDAPPPEAKRSNALVDAYRDCTHLAELEGVERLELEVGFLGGAPEEGTLVAEVIVTTGRQVPCADPVDEPQAADAPGVRRFDALAECIRESMDPSTYDFSPLPEGEERRFTQFMWLDGMPAAPALPELPEGEAVPDPEQAIAAFDLPALGPKGARTSIVECGDYDCPFCRRAAPKLDELRARYGDEIAIYWLHNPLPMHAATAIPAARAAVAADEQGQFWAFHAALLSEAGPHDRSALVELARRLGLDVAKFEADMDSASTDETIARHARTCNVAGAHGTPSFFVGGDLISGDQPIDRLALLVEDARE